MKLEWKQPESSEWTAEGTNYSYSVSAHRFNDNYTVYRVEQERQPGGQVVNTCNVASLDGAFACAQVWENREHLRR